MFRVKPTRRIACQITQKIVRFTLSPFVARALGQIKYGVWMNSLDWFKVHSLCSQIKRVFYFPTTGHPEFRGVV